MKQILRTSVGQWRIPALVACIAAPLLPGRPAMAFGGDGHSIVADVALLELSRSNTAADKKALAAVNKLLNTSGSTVEQLSQAWEDAAVWADDMRPPRFPSSPENAARKTEVGKGFLEKLSKKYGPKGQEHHTGWHFVDVPFNLMAPVYSRPYLKENDDLVQVLRICAQTLKDGKSPTGSPIKFTKQEAVRLLFHYVGDLHQPLHVGCGFPKVKDGKVDFVIPTSPKPGHFSPGSDQGGNKWYVTPKTHVPGESKTMKLHAYWDTHLVQLIASKRTNLQTATVLNSKLTPMRQRGLKSHGKFTEWPEAWANDTLKVSPRVYKNVVCHVAPTNDETDNADLPETAADHYESRSTRIIEHQLEKAGFRLADILRETLGR